MFYVFWILSFHAGLYSNSRTLNQTTIAYFGDTSEASRPNYRETRIGQNDIQEFSERRYWRL